MKISLFGLSIFSGNKGCSALAYSFLDLLEQICETNLLAIEVVLYLFGKPVENDGLQFLTARWKRLNISFKEIHLKQFRFWKELKINAQGGVCLDFTEGDSFTDLYGLKRFFVQSFIKTFVIANTKNMILGPQTYGPYKNWFVRLWASWIINHSKRIYSRDAMSRDLLLSMTKKDVRIVTDVAVALQADRTREIHCGKIKAGVNVSALLWNGGYTRNNQFALSVNYAEYMDALIKKLSEDGRYKVYLIPHVIADKDFNNVENDLKICTELHQKYPDTELVAEDFSPSSLKGVISQMDVFTGARMHSTIAAFSTKVPVIPFAYSKKFEDFFGLFGYDFVLDGRKLRTDEAINLSLEYIEKRDELKTAVELAYAKAKEKIDVFYNELENLVRGEA